MDPEKKRLRKIIPKRFNLEDILIGLTVLLGIIVIINIVMAASLSKDLKKSLEISTEKLKPAKIELALIRNSKCADCFDISAAAGNFRKSGVNITKENSFEFDSSEGKSLISKYRIEKVPAIVLTGEIEKVAIQGLEKKDNALLFTQINPPYTNPATGKIEGRVSLYYLKDNSCGKCNDLSPLISQLKAAGVKIYEEKNIEPSSDKGKELIAKYSIGFVPAIILSQDAGVYELIKQAWAQIGSKEKDGSYVLRLVSPPFINLTTGKLMGLVDIVYLTDKSCAECYNVSLHKEILTSPQSFAVKLDKEETYDISDAKGKELIVQYNITKVPAVILSEEISAYPSSQGLRKFFSAEKDGKYIFRTAEALGTYKDLADGQIVKSKAAQQAQG